MACLKYIVENPMKAGLAEDPQMAWNMDRTRYTTKTSLTYRGQ